MAFLAESSCKWVRSRVISTLNGVTLLIYAKKKLASKWLAGDRFGSCWADRLRFQGTKGEARKGTLGVIWGLCETIEGLHRVLGFGVPSTDPFYCPLKIGNLVVSEFAGLPVASATYLPQREGFRAPFRDSLLLSGYP